MITTTRPTAETVKRLGKQCGFDLVRISRAEPLHQERLRYLTWVAAGRHGEMRWISEKWAERSSDPTSGFDSAKSVISVGLSYGSTHRPRSAPNEGRIARYAWGRDYHEVLGEKLRTLADLLRVEFGGDHHWYVDTGPQMDKALAARSGLGWYGKSTNILTEKFGSFVLLGEIITDLELEPDLALNKDCGACRLCVVACPTGALGPDYSIDGRKCISYLTIEHRGPIPRELRPLIGAWVFGCDICQDVCPPTMQPFLKGDEDRRAWLAEVRSVVAPRRGSAPVELPLTPADAVSTPEFARGSNHLYAEGIRPTVDLVWLLNLTHEQYLDAFRHTSIRRAKPWMLRRNAAVALGNVGLASSIPALAQTLIEDENPVVRGHSAWGLAQVARRLRRSDLTHLLDEALNEEDDPQVRDEILVAQRDIR